MPEDNPETGVKEVAVESPSAAAQTETVEAPAESTSVQPKTEKENHVPYFRFKEVNEKMRSYESELAKLRSEKELATQKAAPSENDKKIEEDDMSKYARRLKEHGLDEKASGVLAEVMKDIAKEEAKDRYSKEQARTEERQKAEKAAEQDRFSRAQKDIANWESEFSKSHSDYASYRDKMQKEWESLDPEAQKAFVTSPKSFEALYKLAKASDLESEKEKSEEEGRNSAYETKKLKSAVSSTPGATANPGKKLTAEDVGKMSVKEYRENREKVLKDLGLKK